VPYTGSDKNMMCFNFCLSQLRIKTEQAFGLLVNKWRDFKKPIELNLTRTPSIMNAASDYIIFVLMKEKGVVYL